MKLGTFFAIFFSLFSCASVIAGQPTAAPSAQADDVIKHLEQAIRWYRGIAAADRDSVFANDVLEREAARRMSGQALQLAFKFARAEGALLASNQPPTQPAPAPEQSGRRLTMDQIAAKARQRVAIFEQRLRKLDSAAAKPASSRALMAARRQQLLDQLALAKQVESSVKDMAAFIETVSVANDSFAGRIDQLERSVPEAMRDAKLTGAGGGKSSAGGAVLSHSDSAGIFSLASELISLARAKRRLNRLIERTEALLQQTNDLRIPLSTELRAAIRRSDALAADSSSATAEQIAATHSQIEAISSRVQQLSAALVPLREEGILIETSSGSLAEWRDAVAARYSTVGRYLLVRCIALALAIGVLLVLSEFWRRMTFRYARDPRRRRQFLVLRRLVVGAAIAFVAVLGFVSDIGSLATYAGFLTAGLAVALQNPILSVVAYFFLIGRYGLRVGDRVTISGVTGDVIDIGLVRMHVMELAGSNVNLHPTGRVVAFSNSVLFQPAALFKRMPGTDYVWRTATVVLAGECDAQSVEARLMSAVRRVYDEYREQIEAQHALFEQSVDMKISPPEPRGRVRFTDAGLEFSVDYPVELNRGPAIDGRILRALQEAVSPETGLTFASSGEPRLLPAT